MVRALHFSMPTDFKYQIFQDTFHNRHSALPSRTTRYADRPQ